MNTQPSYSTMLQAAVTITLVAVGAILATLVSDAYAARGARSDTARAAPAYEVRHAPAETVTPRPPDLVPDRVIGYGPDTGSRCVGPDTRFGLFVAFENRSDGAAGPFNVSFNELRLRHEGLAGHQRGSLFFGAAGREAGTLTVDVDNEVEESDESNNSVDTYPAIVGTLPARCTSTPTPTPPDVTPTLLFVPALGNSSP